MFKSQKYEPCVSYEAIWSRKEDTSSSWIMSSDIIKRKVTILGFIFNNNKDKVQAVCNVSDSGGYYNNQIRAIDLNELELK